MKQMQIRGWSDFNKKKNLMFWRQFILIYINNNNNNNNNNVAYFIFIEYWNVNTFMGDNHWFGRYCTNLARKYTEKLYYIIGYKKTYRRSGLFLIENIGRHNVSYDKRVSYTIWVRWNYKLTWEWRENNMSIRCVMLEMSHCIFM